MMEALDQYLKPTEIIDCDHPGVRGFAEKTLGDSANAVDKAVRLNYAVRGGIWYDPYHLFYLPEHYRARAMF
jgi:transglutaminase-like putative cysteine protease